MAHYQIIMHRPAIRYMLVLPIIAGLIGLLTACSQGSLATRSVQPSEEVSDDNEIFTVVETPPNFPGGSAQLGNYLRRNLRYPEDAKKNEVQGKVFVSFIIRKDGAIQDAQVLKGIGHGADEEAVRLVQSMPNWKPGQQAGRPVNVKYNVVIPFDLGGLK